MFGDRVKKRRLELGYNQDYTAELVGIKKNTLSGYEHCKSFPSEAILLKLMEVLKCNADYLFDTSTAPYELTVKEHRLIEKYRSMSEHSARLIDIIVDFEYSRNETADTDVPEEKTVKLPFSLLPVSAGYGEWLTEENTETRDYPDCPEARQADIVIPVTGDSMEPVFSDGDELYVRLQPAVKIGEYGIFAKNGEAFVKKLGDGRLISLNPNYPDILTENVPVECCGKVIGKVEKAVKQNPAVSGRAKPTKK